MTKAFHDRHQILHTSARIACRCGQVQGQVTNARPGAVNRAVCYCDDCQAFAHFLGRADLLDGRGGTDIVQIAPASLTITAGEELIEGLRLTPKGLLRCHSTCCQTPLGNMVRPSIPFVGLVTKLFETAGQSPDLILGPSRGAVMPEFAIGGPRQSAQRTSLGLILTSIAKVLWWAITGKGQPNPFFAAGSDEPRYPVKILTPAQREALRPLCGPKPTRDAGS